MLSENFLDPTTNLSTFKRADQDRKLKAERGLKLFVIDLGWCPWG